MSRASTLLLLGLAGCAIDTSFLFPAAFDGVPSMVHLGELEPLELTSQDELRDAVIYGEVGPTGTARSGAVTFTFKGYDGPVCVWMDPELATWNLSIDRANPNPIYRLPDNVYDDGDLDMTAGLSVFYSGTFGEEKGTFQVDFDDALGNEVPVAFLECGQNQESLGTPPFNGRGAPESCLIESSTSGTTYTVLLDVWSLPVDDNRLGYGVLVTKSTCAQLESFMIGGGGFGAGVTANQRECLIQGEAIRPGAGGTIGPRAERAGLPEGTWLGISEVRPWERSTAFEAAFCESTLFDFCRAEQRAVRQGERSCSWELPPDDVANDAGDVVDTTRCFCGDIDDTPNGDVF